LTMAIQSYRNAVEIWNASNYRPAVTLALLYLGNALRENGDLVMGTTMIAVALQAIDESAAKFAYSETAFADSLRLPEGTVRPRAEGVTIDILLRDLGFDEVSSSRNQVVDAL
jgi:hypothetical protein